MRPTPVRGHGKTVSAEAKDQGKHGANYAEADEEANGDDGPEDSVDALELKGGSR